MKKVFVVAMAVVALSLSVGACSKAQPDDFNSPAKVYKGQ